MPGSVITFAHHLQLKLSQFRGAIRAGHAFLQVDGDIGDTGIVEINDTSRTETQRTIKWMKRFCFLRRSHWQVSEGTLDHMRNSESITSTISATNRRESSSAPQLYLSTTRKYLSAASWPRSSPTGRTYRATVLAGQVGAIYEALFI